MKQRVITAVVALALFIPVIWYGGLLLQGVVALLAVIGVYELFRMKGLKMLSFEGVLAGLGAIILVLPMKNWFFFLPATVDNQLLYYVIVLLLLSLAVFSKNTYTFDDAAFPVLVSLYVGMGFQSFILARGEGQSFVLLMYALFIVWATDIGAYMIGRKIGKHKFAPHISPNKTLEGSVGGVVCALVVAVLYFLLYPAKEFFGYSLPVMLLLTILFSIGGQLGDLVESAFKRHYQVKDSGKILPGHGGILDRFDSILFVFPIMHLFGLF